MVRKILVGTLLLTMASCSIEKRPQGTDPGAELNVGNLTQGDTVKVSIAAPPAAAVGDEVPITLVVENNRDRRIDLNLVGNDVVFDIIIANQDSVIVWQRLANRTLDQDGHVKTLPERGAFILTDRWRPLAPGDYVIGATLPTDTLPLRAKPVTLRVR